MLLIDNQVVAEVLTMEACIAVQERAFAGLADGASICRPRIDTLVPCSDENSYFRFGSIEGATNGMHAIRLKSDIMTWPKHADGTWTRQKFSTQPGTFCGLVLLFSTENGEPLAILNDGILQHMRVGAAAGIGARLLSRTDSRRVGLIGTGGMARTTLEALVAVRPIEEVRVYSRNQQNRANFAKEMSVKLGIVVTPVDSAREAVRNADILATATDSMLPVVEGDWLKAGMHVVAMGPQDLAPECEERMDVIVRQGEEVLDLPETERYKLNLGHSRNAFVAGNSEQQKRLPLIPRKLTPQRSSPLYVDLITGHSQGRTNSAQITQYRAVGLWGLQFAACGAHVYRLAKERGLGRELPNEWFVQNIRN
jgi:alanine dehydrogenase